MSKLTWHTCISFVDAVLFPPPLFLLFLSEWSPNVIGCMCVYNVCQFSVTVTVDVNRTEMKQASGQLPAFF